MYVSACAMHTVPRASLFCVFLCAQIDHYQEHRPRIGRDDVTEHGTRNKCKCTDKSTDMSTDRACTEKSNEPPNRAWNRATVHGSTDDGAEHGIKHGTEHG